MREHLTNLGRVAVFAVVAAVAATRAPAQLLKTDLPRQAKGLAVNERLGEQLPLEAQFTNDAAKPVSLANYFEPGNTRPAIVALVYYRCPVVCTVVMAKLVECLNQVDYTAGKDYRVLLFSIKDEETAIDAAGAKARYLALYTRAEKDPAAKDGWQFHAGTPENTKKFADALGFTYRRETNGEYAHPVAIFIATPQGKISRYLYGLEYKPETVKMALLEASSGTIAKTLGEKFMPFCYRYDPAAGTYTLQAFRLMKIGGVITMVLVFGLVAALRISESVRRRRAAGVSAGNHAGLPPGVSSGGASGMAT